MIRTEDERFVYSFDKRKIDNGQTLWHCDVCLRGEVVPLVTSISLTSGVAAQDEARRALRRLYAAAQVPMPPVRNVA
jgi:hypothetical protein